MEKYFHKGFYVVGEQAFPLEDLVGIRENSLLFEECAKVIEAPRGEESIREIIDQIYKSRIE